MGSSSMVLERFSPQLGEMSLYIFLGYFCSRVGFVKIKDLRGMNRFVGEVCLPVMLFLSLAELDLSLINWVFVGGIFLAKTFVFILVVIASMTFDKRVEKPHRFITAGLRAICATQSNDYALGLPILLLLYSTTHPEYPLLLYVISPISLVILNPIAFLICEYGMHTLLQQQPSVEVGNIGSSTANSSTVSLIEFEEKLDDKGAAEVPLLAPSSSTTDGEGGGSTTRITVSTSTTSLGQDGKECSTPTASQPLSSPTSSTTTVVIKVVKEVIRNPVVLMTFLGCGTNAALGGDDLPPFIHDWLTGLANIFPVASLFLMGANMSEAGGVIDGSYLYATSLTIACKNLLLPIMAYLFVSVLGGDADIATFAFIVGTFPIAPTVNIYGLRYSTPEKDYCSRLSAATVASTVIGVPLLFLCVVGIQIMVEKDVSLMQTSIYYLYIPCTITSAWVLLVFVVDGGHWRSRYIAVFLLSLLSLARGTTGMVCYNTSSSTTIDMLAVVMTGTAMGIMVVTTVAALTLTRAGAMMSRSLYIVGMVLVVSLASASAVLLRLNPRPTDEAWRDGCITTNNTALDKLLSLVSVICFILSLIGFYFKNDDNYSTTESGGGGGGGVVDDSHDFPHESSIITLTTALLPDSRSNGASTSRRSASSVGSNTCARALRCLLSGDPMEGHISKRLLLTIQYSLLTMSVVVIRTLIKTFSDSTNTDFLLFLELSLMAFQGLVLACLYGFEKDSVLVRVIRQWYRRLKRLLV